MMADVNGDGMADIVGFFDDGVWVSRATGGGWFETPARKWLDNYFGSDPASGWPKWKAGYHPRMLGDANGDGMADIVGFGGNDVYVALSTGTGFTTPEIWLSGGLGHFVCNKDGWATQGETPRYLADVNGDGLSDIVGFSDEYGVRVALSTGCNAGGFTQPLKWLDINYSGNYSYVNDMNGDGRADVVAFTTGIYGPTAYISYSTGAGFTARYGVNLFSYLSDHHMGPFFVADVNGDGKGDPIGFVGSEIPASLTPTRSKEADGDVYVSVSDTDPLDVLETVKVYSGTSNYPQSESTLRYACSSAYDNEYLPFKVFTVSSIEVTEKVTHTSTSIRYDYERGKFDPADRDFRGFGRVTRTNPDGTVAETRFHQDEYQKGRIEEVETRDPDGALLNRTRFTWQTDHLGGEAGFVKLAGEQSELYDTHKVSGPDEAQTGTVVTSRKSSAYSNTHGGVVSATVSGERAEDVTTSYTYQNFGDWLWRVTQETVTGKSSGKVRQTSFGYDRGSGNMLWEEHMNSKGKDPRLQYEYDGFGNQTRATDARGNSTATTYDAIARQFPQTVTYPATDGVSHAASNLSFDYRFGKVTARQDENGNVTKYAYDDFGRTIRVDYPDGGYVAKQYDDSAFPRYTVTRAAVQGGETVDSYAYVDGLGRTIQTLGFGENGKSVVTRLYYDDMGRNDLSAGPFFSSGTGYPKNPPSNCPARETDYDYRGRPKYVRHQDGAWGEVETAYTYFGLDTIVRDPDGGQRSEYRDYLGRIVSVWEWDGTGWLETAYAYNAAGDMTRVTDAHGNITTITYDTLGRKVSMNDPAMGYWTYQYDKNGNLTTQTDAEYQTVAMDYDALNRLTRKRYSTGDPTVAYYYDLGFSPNGKGRLGRVDNGVVNVYYSYDRMGRVTEIDKDIEGDRSRVTSYEFDLAGRVVEMGYPDGFRVFYDYYDGTGLLKTVTGSDGVTYAEFTDYDATGRMGRMAHGNGTASAYAYDPESKRVTEIQTYDGFGNHVQYRTYEYSRAGDLTDTHTDVGVDPGWAPTLTYDYETNGYGKNMFQVASVSTGGPGRTFGYDANGNIVEEPYMERVGYAGTRKIDYNADNMPVRVTSNRYNVWTTVDYAYDGDGARAKKTSGGNTTYYIGGHFEIRDGQTVKYIFAGAIRIAMLRGGGTLYFHKDHQGSTTAVTNQDGNLIERIEYLPFGALAYHEYLSKDWLVHHRFTDQEWEEETGLYNYNARLYDPIVRRFITPDTIVQNPFRSPDVESLCVCQEQPASVRGSQRARLWY